jgi:hypothetical protein
VPATRTAAVVDALVTALRAALPGGVEVIDGQPLNLDQPDVIVVGFSADRVAVEVSQQRSDLGGGRSDALSIVCLASAWRGDTSMAAVRDRSVELLTSVQDVLAADRTLGGVVRRVELGYEMSLDQAQTKDGATATVEFTVQAVTH